ncbi:hypothetical protein Ssi03_07770 [Sphaerisporangium siamense]|nr:hypothetical protein Ssi03_07770 [Sphaerisporangium siamense]
MRPQAFLPDPAVFRDARTLTLPHSAMRALTPRSFRDAPARFRHAACDFGAHRGRSFGPERGKTLDSRVDLRRLSSHPAVRRFGAWAAMSAALSVDLATGEGRDRAAVPVATSRRPREPDTMTPTAIVRTPPIAGVRRRAPTVS